MPGERGAESRVADRAEGGAVVGLRGGLRAAAAQQGLDAGFQLVQVKRFGQVVVGPGVQAQDAVAHGAACGQDDDGRGQPLRPGLGEHHQAVLAGQAEVEQHQVGQGAAPLGQRPCAIGAGQHLETPAAQGALQGGLQGGVVFDQQQFHGG